MLLRSAEIKLLFHRFVLLNISPPEVAFPGGYYAGMPLCVRHIAELKLRCNLTWWPSLGGGSVGGRSKVQLNLVRKPGFCRIHIVNLDIAKPGG